MPSRRRLYVCDESGMPALRRRLEGIASLPKRPEIHAVVTVGDESYKDYLAHLSAFNITWAFRQAGDAFQAATQRRHPGLIAHIQLPGVILRYHQRTARATNRQPIWRT